MLQDVNESTVEDTMYRLRKEKAQAKAKAKAKANANANANAEAKQDAPKWSWSFGSGSYIDVCRDGFACVHFNYNDKLKIRMAWSVGHFSREDWEQVLNCIKEAKVILKKIRKV